MELMLERLTDVEKIRNRRRDTKESNDDGDTNPIWYRISPCLCFIEMRSIEDSFLSPKLLYEKEYAIPNERRSNRENDKLECE